MPGSAVGTRPYSFPRAIAEVVRSAIISCFHACSVCVPEASIPYIPHVVAKISWPNRRGLECCCADLTATMGVATSRTLKRHTGLCHMSALSACTPAIESEQRPTVTMGLDQDPMRKKRLSRDLRWKKYDRERTRISGLDLAYTLSGTRLGFRMRCAVNTLYCTNPEPGYYTSFFSVSSRVCGSEIIGEVEGLRSEFG